MKNRKSGIAPGAVVKQVARFAGHPWIWTRLAMLQGEKWLFDLAYPRAYNGRAGKIRQISFRLTDLCNLRCHTCGQWGDLGFLHGKNLNALRKEEVTPARYVEVLEDLVRHRHRPLVYLWGGEPMLYPGTIDIIEKATSLRLPTSIATNGTRVGAAARRLVKAPLFLLQISIDGHCAELHNRLRPSANAMDNFSQIEDALQTVRRERSSQGKRFPVIVSLTVISKANFRHLVDIYETFRHKVDLFVFYLGWWIDTESARVHEQEFHRRFGFFPTRHRGWMGDWKPDDYAALSHQLDSLLRLSSPLKAPAVTVIPHISGATNLESYYTEHACRFGFDRCISLYQAVEVNSNGDVSPCRDYHDYVVGNIKTTSITDLWNSRRYIEFRKSLANNGLMPTCSRCCGLMGY